MKNIKNGILYAIISILTTIIIISGIMITNNFYSRVAMVTEIDEENNLITVTCGNSNMFGFYDTDEDWCVGDLCSLIMYDNCTEVVYDDKVVYSRYEGYLELFEFIELELVESAIEETMYE